jgi:hypothetical protein
MCPHWVDHGKAENIRLCENFLNFFHDDLLNVVFELVRKTKKDPVTEIGNWVWE